MMSFMYEFKSNSFVSLFWQKIEFVEVVIILKVALFIRLTHSFRAFFNTFILFSIFNNLFNLTIWFDETFFSLFFKSLILTISVFTKVESMNDDWMINDEFFFFFSNRQSSQIAYSSKSSQYLMFEWLTKRRASMIEIEIEIEMKIKKQMFVNQIDMIHNDIQLRMNDTIEKRIMSELTCWKMQSKTSSLMHWLMYSRMQSKTSWLMHWFVY